jgi:hypothetical protein
MGFVKTNIMTLWCFRVLSCYFIIFYVSILILIFDIFSRYTLSILTYQ